MMKRLLIILAALNIAACAMNVIRGDMKMAISCIVAVALCVSAYIDFN